MNFLKKKKLSAPLIVCDDLIEDAVTFYLFTDYINDTELYENDLYAVDVSLPTVVVIHGWETTSNDSWIVELTDAYIATGDYNIITVNWSPIAYLDYILARLAVKSVGESKKENNQFKQVIIISPTLSKPAKFTLQKHVYHQLIQNCLIRHEWCVLIKITIISEIVCFFFAQVNTWGSSY